MLVLAELQGPKGWLKWYPGPCLCCRVPGKCQQEYGREWSSSTSSHPVLTAPP